LSGDLEAAVAMLAADNCRLIDMVLAAEKIIEHVKTIGLVKYAGHKRLGALIDAYDLVKAGQ
jgi:hypothetical protein